MILQGDTVPDDIYVKTYKLEEKAKREEKLKIKAATIEQFFSPAKHRAVSVLPKTFKLFLLGFGQLLRMFSRFYPSF